MNTRTEKLKQIQDEVLVNDKLPLFAYRKENNYFPVFGEGSYSAEIMLVGEAPGRNEAKTGHPFCGAAGKILDELLAHAGLGRDEIYITNIVKDRPPENRDPLPAEIAAYAPYLDRQIEIIRPKVLGGLGRFSSKYLLQKFGLEKEAARPIGELHGKIFKAQAPYGKIKIVPLYHPAVAVYNGNQKASLKKDFEALKNTAS